MIREDVHIEVHTKNGGGQQAGTDDGIVVITHKVYDVKIVIPVVTRRSQHQRIQAGLEAMEYLVDTL